MNFVSPIGYPGGKYYMLKDIYDILLQNDFDIIVDVFGGSGKVLLNMPMNTLFGRYRGVYNDIDKKNINFYTVVRDKSDDLVKLIDEFKVDDRYIYNINHGYNFDTNKTFYEELDDVNQAFATWCMYKYAWSGRAEANYRKKVDDVSINSTYTSDQIRRASVIVKSWSMYNLDFEKLKFLDSKRTMWYFDPPYRESNVYFYNFSDVDFRRLFRFIHSLEGQYLMNIDEDGYNEYVFGEPNMVKSYRNLMTRPDNASDRNEWFYWKFYR